MTILAQLEHSYVVIYIVHLEYLQLFCPCHLLSVAGFRLDLPALLTCA